MVRRNYSAARRTPQRRLAEAMRMCKLYVLFTRRRVRASRPAAGGAAPALGGSYDGRASLYGDGLVRLWLDGSAANGAHAGSHSRLDAGFIRRLQRVIIRCPRQAHPAESQVDQEIIQEIEPRLSQEVLSAEGRKEISQKVRQEEHQEVSPEVRQEGRAGFGSKERAEKERPAILRPEGSKEGAGWPEAVTRSVSSASRGGPGRRHN